jgi:GTPase SAR1 family protein
MRLLFNQTNTEPFRSVLEWREELEKYCEEDIPVILVGCKSDLPNHALSYEQIKVRNITVSFEELKEHHIFSS